MKVCLVIKGNVVPPIRSILNSNHLVMMRWITNGWDDQIQYLCMYLSKRVHHLSKKGDYHLSKMVHHLSKKLVHHNREIIMVMTRSVTNGWGDRDVATKNLDRLLHLFLPSTSQSFSSSELSREGYLSKLWWSSSNISSSKGVNRQNSTSKFSEEPLNHKRPLKDD